MTNVSSQDWSAGAQALFWGALSALSFPLGALIAIFRVPSEDVNGMLLAFGNGALLCALSVEMFAESSQHHFELERQGHKTLADLGTAAVMLGSTLGAITFLLLNRKLSRNSGIFATRTTCDFERHLQRSRLRQSRFVQASYAAAQLAQHHQTTPTDTENSKATESTALAHIAPPPPSPLSLWLGMMLDGIPEAMVIGFMTRQDRVSFGFVVGVFAANLPEALAAASLMRRKLSVVKIVMLWWSLVVVTGCVAGLTAWLLPLAICPNGFDVHHILHEFIEGLAGGAMLGMLSCAAIPESFHMAHDKAGPLTVLGFLCILFVVVLSGENKVKVTYC